MSWGQSLVFEVNEITQVQLLKWAEIIEELGTESVDLDEYKNIVKSNVESLYKDMIEEVETMKAAIGSRIMHMLQKCEVLCKELSVEMPQYGKNNLSLYKEQALLAESIAE